MSYKPREENIPVGGRMKHFLYNWEKLSKDQWVLETVKGLELEFIQIPSVQTKLSNCHIIPNSERRDRIYVREKSHLRSKPTKVRNRLHKPHFFFGREKGRGHRPIINLRDLNSFMVYRHFKMEGINQVKDIIQQGDWLIKIDLKDAYFTIPIYKADQKYLRFPWE